MEKTDKKVVLTGDRPTGRLHLGHYVGSLKNRIRLQNLYKQYVMIADVQALTDNADNPAKVRDNVLQVAMDNLAVGIDPKKTCLFIQSEIPEIAELTVFFLNLVTLARLQRNPTVKDEMREKGFGANVPAGFLAYPVSQSADILFVKASLVPGGEDQKPMIEQTNEIVDRFNSFYGKTFDHVDILVSETPRLVGTDGKAKMSKSLGNTIYLSDDADTIEKKVMSMYTDPKHIYAKDPGQIKGNVVFEYLSVFDPNKDELRQLEDSYSKGGVGDVKIKKRLIDILENLISPIRSKRRILEKNPGEVMKILENGIGDAREKAKETMHEVKKAMQIDYFKK